MGSADGSVRAGIPAALCAAALVDGVLYTKEPGDLRYWQVRRSAGTPAPKAPHHAADHNLPTPAIYERFGGVDGSAYFTAASRRR